MAHFSWFGMAGNYLLMMFIPPIRLDGDILCQMATGEFQGLDVDGWPTYLSI